MKDVLRYKGFEGSVHYHQEDDCLWGELLGVRGAILYEGNDLYQLYSIHFHSGSHSNPETLRMSSGCCWR
jgi:predicted HicB family RNase H-like nuclease